MSLDVLCGNIREREIVLYGDVGEIKDFLNKYKEVLKIKDVLTDHKKEVKLQEFSEWGIRTSFVEDVCLSDKLIVICARNKFGILSKRLNLLNMEEYRDFISQELIETLLWNKKLMVCIGTHMLGQMAMFLKNHAEATKEYDIIYFAESEIYELYMNRMQEYMHICRCCDVYIHSSFEKEKAPLKILDKTRLKEDCHIISVADYGFSGYFPQIEKSRDKYNDFMLRGRERLNQSYETFAFSRTDNELEKYCKAYKNIDVIVNELLSMDYYSADDVISYFEEELKRFKKSEVADDIKLGTYIEQNKQKCLCRNLNEWNEPVISYIVNQLLQKIGLPELSMDIKQREMLIEENSGSEILIYPSVQKALGLSDKMYNKRYRVTTYCRVRYLEMEEYLRFNAEYLSKALDLMKLMGVDEELQNRIMS